MTTPTSFLISGIQGNTVPIATTDVTVTESRRLLPRGSRDAGAGEMAVRADEVARVELNNGFVLWSRADDLIAEHGTRVVARGGGETWEISLRPPIRMDQRGERGWLKLGIRALDFFGIDLAGIDLLIVENIGNLVCPAEFDIGEDRRVVVLSVTEGEDKPAKYPLMFRQCDATLLNKIDLLPYLDFDMVLARQTIDQINPGMPVFDVSAKTEAGFDEWIGWLTKQVIAKVNA